MLVFRFYNQFEVVDEVNLNRLRSFLFETCYPRYQYLSWDTYNQMIEIVGYFDYFYETFQPWVRFNYLDQQYRLICPISQQPINRLYLTSCNHAFEFDCIKDYLSDKTKARCPICRTVINNPFNGFLRLQDILSIMERLSERDAALLGLRV